MVQNVQESIKVLQKALEDLGWPTIELALWALENLDKIPEESDLEDNHQLWWWVSFSGQRMITNEENTVNIYENGGWDISSHYNDKFIQWEPEHTPVEG